MPISVAQLRTILVEPGLITAADFDTALTEAKRKAAPLENVLVEKNLVPDDYLGQLVADALGFPFARVQNSTIPDHILRIIPERVARRRKAVALGIDDDGKLKVALCDPEDLEFIRLIEKKMSMPVKPLYATLHGIESGIEHYAQDIESAIKKLLKESMPAAADEDIKGGRKKKKAAPKTEEEEDRNIRMVELIMNYAYQNNASDVHIEPRENEVVVRYRVDGILHDVVGLPREFMDPIVTRIKILCRLRTDEHFAAQDGKFQEMIGGERIDVRVSVLPIVDGEKVVMRLLTEKGKRFSLLDLGFSEEDMKKVERHMQKSFGMILATGPTGSGKTTTMYAVLKILNTRDVNIATIEDPIEYAMEGVNQIQVNQRAGLTFASGLRSIVRQDPDIIMVGEIRDEETAGISVNAAMTGHLVLSTLHTNDAATTLPRFRDMKVEPFLIASTVNVIIAQRLVRRVCGRCIVTYELTREELLKRLPADVVDEYFVGKHGKIATGYKGKGCTTCNHTGYQGRIGIYEVLEMTDNIREHIMKGSPANLIAQQAVKNGMTTMFEDGIRKVLAGLTTVEEVMRMTGG